MASGPSRVRLDELLVRRGHAPSREKARALVLAGCVAIGGSRGLKPGSLVREDVALDVAQASRYVSRGGIKLEHALRRFAIDPLGRTCADIGASTGGFSDCLLQHGAAQVYAIDVGHGQLDWRLRTDPRVVVLDRTNARYLDQLPERVSLVVIDASFISIRLLMPAALRIADDQAEIVALLKPQFEAGRGRVGKGGVVRDPGVHREVLASLALWFAANDVALMDLTPSPIRGASGNVEFFAHIRVPSPKPNVPGSPGEVRPETPDLGLVDRALAESEALFGGAK